MAKVKVDEIVKKKIKEKDFNGDWVTNKEILGMIYEDKHIEYGFTLTNYTVAHKLASLGELKILSEDILKLATKEGWTVAHELATTRHWIPKNWTTDNYNILKLADKNNWTVAHELGARLPERIKEDYEIMSLKDSDGQTVAETVLYNDENWDPKNEKIRNMKIPVFITGREYFNSFLDCFERPLLVEITMTIGEILELRRKNDYR